MKKEQKNDWVMCVILVLLALAALPYIFPSTWIPLLQVSAEVITAIAAVLAVLIAFMAYNKFGIEQKFLERQFDLVNELTTEISSIQFSIRSVDLNPDEHYTWIFFSPRHAHKFLERPEYEKEKIIIADSYIDAMRKLEKLTSNLLMPKTIADAVKPLEPEVIGQPEKILFGQYKNKGYFYILDGRPRVTQDYKMQGFLNSEDMTIEQFAMHWRNVVVAIEGWLEKHGQIPIELNR